MPDSRRLFLKRSGSFSQRAYGALLVLGLVAIIAPFSAGEWAISILGLVVLVAGAAEVEGGANQESFTLTLVLSQRERKQTRRAAIIASVAGQSA
jgi:uncharacterized membrane protein HdeD (DUF308 family)